MSKEDHLIALKRKHAQVEADIEEEQKRPQPDDTRLTDLKRNKLHIKEEIQNFEEQTKAE